MDHIQYVPNDGKPFAVCHSWGPGRTKADFYRQGQTSARMGNTRSPGDEYSIPVFGMGDSWQAKAFKEGFCAHCASIGVKVILIGSEC